MSMGAAEPVPTTSSRKIEFSEVFALPGQTFYNPQDWIFFSKISVVFFKRSQIPEEPE
jgi:hypothetical protein